MGEGSLRLGPKKKVCIEAVRLQFRHLTLDTEAGGWMISTSAELRWRSIGLNWHENVVGIEIGRDRALSDGG